MNRVILHVDLDYFYVQLEEQRKPELKGKPVCVGMFSGRTAESGAIATSNYAARDFGVRAGMPIAFAKSKSRELIILPADREYYNDVSERIMILFREFADAFEQMSIDEAYMDVSERVQGSYAEARKLCVEIKKKLMDEEKLTCSIGIGPNKLIAKMASSTNKPDGITLVTPNEVKEFLRGKRISDLHGIGSKTFEMLKEKGISTIPKLAETDVTFLQEMFGKNKGVLIHEKSLGIDESVVEEREKQQLSRIKTLKENTQNPDVLVSESKELADSLAKKALEMNVFFRTISTLIISDRLESVTRSRTIQVESGKSEEIMKIVEELFREFFTENPEFVARRFGIRISNFSEPKQQKSLFDF